MGTLELLNLERPQVITESYCISIFNTGKAVQGYALWLAKEELHRESKTGWESFLVKLGCSVAHAYKLIDFYKALQEIPIGTDKNILPDSPSKYADLKGISVNEKVQNYSEVKKATGKETPTQKDIREHNSMMKLLRDDYKSNATFHHLTSKLTKTIAN